jgi:MoaA/NifB/PqqE/SkfB family radical SAM enzyme
MEVPPAPKAVKIELTGRCNYRCSFCNLTNRKHQPKKETDMCLDFFKDITRQMREHGVEEIGVFYVGESFYVPELLADAIRYLKRELKFPYVFCTTNGSLASERSLHAVMDAGLDSLKFSITSTFEEFEETVGVKLKMYKQALANLKTAHEIRARCKYKTKLYASSIEYDDEQAKKMEVLLDEYVRPYVDEHYYLPLYTFGSGAIERELELEWKPTPGNTGRVGGQVAPLPCWCAFTEGHVRHDGSVSFCGFGSDDTFDVANLHDDTWENIWENDYFAKIRAAHLKKDVTGTVCETCAMYE